MQRVVDIFKISRCETAIDSAVSCNGGFEQFNLSTFFCVSSFARANYNLRHVVSFHGEMDQRDIRLQRDALTTKSLLQALLFS